MLKARVIHTDAYKCGQKLISSCEGINQQVIIADRHQDTRRIAKYMDAKAEMHILKEMGDSVEKTLNGLAVAPNIIKGAVAGMFFLAGVTKVVKNSG